VPGGGVDESVAGVGDADAGEVDFEAGAVGAAIADTDADAADAGFTEVEDIAVLGEAGGLEPALEGEVGGLSGGRRLDVEVLGEAG